ncbi:MAG: hypothetical protein RR814_06590, partial [Oscillospiraceae bacterium]
PIEHEYDPVIYKDAQYLTDYNMFLNAAEGDEESFPIKSEIIEGYFNSGDKPAYIRMADLLCEVYDSPPRDTPFDSEFKPKFNLLKFFALLGVQALFRLKINPMRFRKISPRIAEFASRIYGYVEKAYISKEDAAAMENKIKKFI